MPMVIVWLTGSTGDLRSFGHWGQDVERFRVSVPIFMGAMVVGFFGFYLTGWFLVVLVMSVGGGIDWPRLLVAFIAGGSAGVACTLALTPVVVWFFPVSISQDGIRSFNFWGLYHTVAWPEVTAVKPVNLLGLRYLFIYSPKLRWPLWVPRFLADPARFKRLVLDYAGPNHPLSQAIRGEVA
jgi:hypothetical protein